MDFKDQIKQLSERVVKLKENIQTEEATKTAFIMPMIQALGYDIFDPTEVVPEFTCDPASRRARRSTGCCLTDTLRFPWAMPGYMRCACAWWASLIQIRRPGHLP